MALYPKIDGSTQTALHIGGPAGPLIRSTGGVLEARDPTNATFAILRGLTPAATNDLVTKGYADALGTPIVTNRTSSFTESAGTYTDICSGIITATATKPNVLVIATASGTALNVAAPAQALFRLTIDGTPFSQTGFGIVSPIAAGIASGSLSYAFALAAGAHTIALQGKIVTPGTLSISILSDGHGAALSLYPF